MTNSSGRPWFRFRSGFVIPYSQSGRVRGWRPLIFIIFRIISGFSLPYAPVVEGIVLCELRFPRSAHSLASNRSGFSGVDRLDDVWVTPKGRAIHRLAVVVCGAFAGRGDLGQPSVTKLFGTICHRSQHFDNRGSRARARRDDC